MVTEKSKNVRGSGKKGIAYFGKLRDARPSTISMSMRIEKFLCSMKFPNTLWLKVLVGRTPKERKSSIR
jgi:hypothetical protein